MLCEPRKWTLFHCGRPRSLSTFEFIKWLLVTIHFDNLAFEYAEMDKISCLSRGCMVTDRLLCVLMNWGASY